MVAFHAPIHPQAVPIPGKSRPVVHSTPDQRIAATLVTGFLGSGKTTLINAVLKNPRFAKTLVIVNEFGEIGLDHLLIEGGQDQVILMDSGCLCCQMNGSLRDTLIDVFMRACAQKIPCFDRVIIETSGLANPVPLISILVADSAVTPRYRLDLVLTVVDALNGQHALSTYDEAVRQVAVADRIVLTKTDLAGPQATDAVCARLSGINGQSPVTAWRGGQDCLEQFAVVESGPAHENRPTAESLADHAVDITDKARFSALTTPSGASRLNHGPLFGNIKGYAFSMAGNAAWPAYAAWSAAMTATFGHRLLRCKGILSIGQPEQFWVIQAVQGFFVPPVRFVPGQGSAPEQRHPRQFMQCICDRILREEIEGLLSLLGLSITTNGFRG